MGTEIEGPIWFSDHFIQHANIQFECFRFNDFEFLQGAAVDFGQR